MTLSLLQGILICMDNPENTYTRDFLMLMDTFSLTQHVQVPTHSCGDRLDLIITIGLNVCTTLMPSQIIFVFSLLCVCPLTLKIGLGLLERES